MSPSVLRYGAVPGVAGLETLDAHDLRLQYDRHFHDTYAFGIVLRGVERCRVGRNLNFYEPGTVPMFNPGEVHDGGPARPEGWSYRMVYVDPALVAGERAFPAQARKGAENLEQVRERIDEECCEPLPLRELSVLAGVSPTRLLRAFAQAYGLSPHRYQQSRRIARAKKLIVAGLPLAEIATACGYADQSHLNRWFLRVHGTTPGRFQRAFFS